MVMKQRKVKVPYSNYELPPSAEAGGKFIDFNEVLKPKVRKIKKVKRNANVPTK